MTHLVALVVSLALLAGFLAATNYERRRGARYFEVHRARLDAHIARLAFIATHVDYPAFLRDTSRELAERSVHALASASLIFVRFVERLLTRAVKYLRGRRQTPPPKGENASAFVNTLADFKSGLRNHTPASVKAEHPLG